MITGRMSIPRSLANAKQKESGIVDAALVLFLNSGYGATSMDIIARHAGVTKQTVYRYFDSKEALLEAVMEKIQRDEPLPHVFGDKDIETELSQYGRKFLSFHLTSSALGLYRMMVSEASTYNLRDIFIKQGPKKRLAPLVRFLQIHGHGDSEFLAQMFASMLLFPRNQHLLQGQREFPESEQQEHVMKVVQLFINGFAVNQP